MQRFARFVVFAACAVGHGLHCPITRADLQGMDVSSLEWLVDSSDAIAVVDVLPAGVKHKRTGLGFYTSQVIKGHKLLAVEKQDDGVRIGHRELAFYRENEGRLAVFRTIDFSTLLVLRVDDGNDEQPCCQYLAVDKQGQIISSPEDLLRRASARVQRGSSLPAQCDREAVEKGTSVRGGFRISPAETYQFAINEKDSFTDVYFHLLVPPDAEFRQRAEAAVRDPNQAGFFVDHRERIPEILRENYPTPEPGQAKKR